MSNERENMPLLDFFKPVSNWDASRVREFVTGRDPHEFNLIDCRFQSEYEAKHLPGAVLAPIERLRAAAAQLDPAKTTIVYCNSGALSRAGAAILQRAGFADVHNLAGGIEAWDGLTVQPIPSASSPPLEHARTLEQLIGILWISEEGTYRFYARTAEILGDPYIAWAFKELAKDELHHQTELEQLYRRAFLGAPDSRFPHSVLPDWEEHTMESGLATDAVIGWAVEVEPRRVAELAMGIEANAHDMHLEMERRWHDKHARAVFHALASQEARHLKRLTSLLMEPRGPADGKAE
jgi:rhodanese-related sulfurtransferase/rubrerythrin